MKRLLALLLFIVVIGYTFVSAYHIAITSAPDFSIFYKTSSDVLHHVSPYTDTKLFAPYNYPLATAVIFIPFSLLPYIYTQMLFTLLSIFFTFGIVLLSFLLVKKHLSLSLFLTITSFVFLSFPTKFTLGMGQINLVAYFLLLLGFFFFQKKKNKWSLFFLILAVICKPILLFTFCIFLLEKQWKFFFLLLGLAAVVLIFFPLIFNQPNANQQFIQTLLHQTLAGREVYYNQGFLGFIARLTPNLPLRSVLYLFVGIQIVLFTFFKQQMLSLFQKLSLILTTLIIIDPLSWQHHFVFLIFPLLTILFAIQKAKTKHIYWYILFAISYILLSSNIKTPGVFSSFPAVLLLSHQFYGVLLLYVLELILL